MGHVRLKPDSTVYGLEVHLLHCLRHHFLLRDRCRLVLAGGDAWRRSVEQLPRPRAGRHDELERVAKSGAINHEKVLTMVSASSRIRSSAARSAMTMLRSRSTALVSSSFTTTYS